MMTTGGLASLFTQPGRSISYAPVNAPNPAPVYAPQRTAYTGGVGAGGLLQGNTLGPQSNQGQSTQLAGWTTNNHAGYYPPPVLPGNAGADNPFAQIGAAATALAGRPTNGMVMQPFKQTGPAVSVANKIAASLPTPLAKPPNPPNYGTLGQWGGGAYSVGSGAPSGFQPTWLQSQNKGNNWYQGGNSGAPQPGTTNSNWAFAPNQDPDSLTWTQRSS